MDDMKNQKDTVIRWYGDTALKKSKSGFLPRKNLLPAQGKNISKFILKIFVKIFAGMKNIY